MDPMTAARFLAAFRMTGRAVPVTAIEAFLRIAAGVDSVPELQAQMGLDPGGASRVVSFLRGRARYNRGRWVEGGASLVLVRKHPHRGGHQLMVSADGIALLDLLCSSAPKPLVVRCTHAIPDPWQSS